MACIRWGLSASIIVLAGAMTTFLPSYNFTWQVLEEDLQLTLNVATDSWVGFGFSGGAGMLGADVVRIDGEGNIEDGYAMGKFAPSKDCQQDWELLSREVTNGITTLVIKRKLSTGDTQDRPVVDDGVPSRIIISHGEIGSGSQFSYHGMHRATTHVNFFSPSDGLELSTLKTDATVKQIELRAHPFGDSSRPYAIPVPGNKDPHTDYHQTCADFPSEFQEAKQQLIAFEAYVSPGNEAMVHHFVVYVQPYTCEEIQGGRDARESRQLWAWAQGTPDFILPSDIGFAVGGPGGAKSMFIDTHYHNPMLEGGITDSSGVTAYYTSNLRQYNMGILELADPNVELFGEQVAVDGTPSDHASWTFLCHPYRLPAGFDGQIKLVGSQLHMHDEGAWMKTSLLDWMGQEKASWKNELYDGAFQDRQDFPNAIDLKEGDSMITTCAYNTKNKDTIFGLATSDEMCIDFVYYYTTTLEAFEKMQDDGRTQCELVFARKPIFDLTRELGIAFGQPPAGCQEAEVRPALEYASYKVGESDINVGTMGAAAAEATAIILCLHGFPQTSAMWFPSFAPEIIRLLGSGTRVVAPDLRGVNFTMPKYPCAEMGCDAYRPGVIAAEVADLVKTHFNTAGPVHVVSHDWGSAIAWILATNYPELVKTLTVTSVPHNVVLEQFLKHDPNQQAASLYAGMWAESDSAFENLKPQPGASSPFDDLFVANPEGEVGLKKAWLHEDAMKHHLYWYRGAEAFATIADMFTADNIVVKVPTLQLWGAEDSALLPRMICCLKHVVDELHVKVFAGVNHWVIDLRGIEVAALVAQLITGGLTMDKCAAVESQCTQQVQGVCEIDGVLPTTTCATDAYTSCKICPGKVLQTEAIAGVDGEESYTCGEAEAWINSAESTLSCDDGQSDWGNQCCKVGPTTTTADSATIAHSTPATTAAPSTTASSPRVVSDAIRVMSWQAALVVVASMLI